MFKTTDRKIITKRITSSLLLVIVGLFVTWYTNSFCVPEGTQCLIPGSYFTGALTFIVATFSLGVLVISIIEYIIQLLRKD